MAILICENQKFGKWTAISGTGKYKSTEKILCVCDCGTKKLVRIADIIYNGSSSCRTCCQRKELDITEGERFGSWTFLGDTERKNGKLSLLCMCDCGNQKFVVYTNLTGGLSKRCSDCKGSNLRYDIVGHKFGRLFVIKNVGVNSKGATKWLCLCDCGNEIITVGKSLVTERTKSCGCYQKELVTNLGRSASTHGMSKTKTYMIWSQMIRRCTYVKHKRYHDYGGRGILVEPRWLEKELGFINFLNDMGECPKGYSIERLDNNGNYEKANCKWIPSRNQSKNTRSTLWVEIDGNRTCLAEACRKSKVKYSTAYKRIKSGWSIEKALGVGE